MPDNSNGRIVRALGDLALHGLREALKPERKSNDVPTTRVEPPVVAQLMIEIRSDGSRTIARGALHDVKGGESAHVHAEGDTPAQLVASLLHSLLTLPSGVLQKLKRPELPKDKK